MQRNLCIVSFLVHPEPHRYELGTTDRTRHGRHAVPGHGTQKLFGWFGGPGVEGASQMMHKLDLHPGRRNALAAGVAETTGGALLALGALTPLAGALITSTMTTAVRKVHGPNGPWIQQQGYEYNLVLITLVAALVDCGPGSPSVDRALGIRRRATPGRSPRSLPAPPDRHSSSRPAAASPSVSAPPSSRPRPGPARSRTRARPAASRETVRPSSRSRSASRPRGLGRRVSPPDELAPAGTTRRVRIAREAGLVVSYALAGYMALL